MAAAGVSPVVPDIRSSDAGMLNDPFKYMLSRRFGLVPLLWFSEALSIGTWWHLCAEGVYEKDYGVSEFQRRSAARLEEIEALLKLHGVQEDAIVDIIERERKSALKAAACYEATINMPVHIGSMLKHGFGTWLRQHDRRPLARERDLRIEMPDLATNLVARPDMLVYDPKAGGVWIIDYKTTASSAIDYCRYAAARFQTMHYIRVTHWALQLGALAEELAAIGAQKRTECLGMVHFVVRKPTISPSSVDCPYVYEAESAKTGYRGFAEKTPKGWRVVVIDADGVEHPKTASNEDDAVEILWTGVGKKPSKVRSSVHDYHAYLARVRDWYSSSERVAADVVNMSITPADWVLDPSRDAEYAGIIGWVARLADAPLDFEHYPRIGSSIQANMNRRPSPYADFYITDPEEWPEVIARNRFIVSHRDRKDRAEDFAEAQAKAEA